MKLPKTSLQSPPSIGRPGSEHDQVGSKQSTHGSKLPELENTDAKDRVAVQSRDRPRGSNVAALRLHQDPELDGEKLRQLLPEHLVAPLVRLFKLVTGPLRREALLGLELVLAQPEPERSVVALLMGRDRHDLSPAQVAGFRATTRDPSAMAEQLAFTHRRHVSLAATAYLPASVRDAVLNALLDHQNAEEAKMALDWIVHMTPRKRRGDHVLQRLLATKVVQDGPAGPSVVQPDSIVTSLATAFREGFRPSASSFASAERKAEAAQIAAKLRSSGLTESRQWKRSDPTGRRGLLAEHLRKLQIREELAGTTAQVVQGILLLRVPEELRRVQSLEEAEAYCDAQSIDREKLVRARTTTDSFFALRYTEIDLTVVKPDQDGRLRFIRFENVKAGSGNAPHAREQNKKAVDGLGNPTVVYLFPQSSGPYRDLSHEIVRNNAREIGLETVGPLGNEAYTKTYGLDSEMLDLVRDALSA